MSKFKDLIDKVVASADPKMMHELNSILDEHLLELEEEYPDMYWEVILDIHELVNGSHFDEEMATNAVSKMKNDDGTIGAHWPYADTTSVANSAGVQFTAYNTWDWYYTLNMIYSDFYSVFGSDVNMYVRTAKAWIEDKDAPEGKAFKYFSAMC